MICPPEYLLSAFYDGELPPKQQAELAAHVESCGVCGEVIRSYRSAGDTLRNAVFAEPSSAMLAGWFAGHYPAQDRGVRRLAGWLTAAAAIVIAATFVMPSSAQADVSTPAAWEADALAGSPDAVATPQAAAQWIVADLSVGSDGGAP